MKRALLVSIATLSLSLAGCSSETGSEDFQVMGLSKEAAGNAAAVLRSKQPGRCHDLAAAMDDPDSNPQDYTMEAEEACSNAAINYAMLHPRKVVPPPDPKLFEPPPVTTPSVASRHLTQEQIEELNKKQVAAMCAAGDCSEPDFTPEQMRNGLAYLAAEKEYDLRMGGLAPDTARKAMWGMSHAPHSSCANFAHLLLMTVHMPSAMPADDPRQYALEIEAHHLCDKENLNR